MGRESFRIRKKLPTIPIDAFEDRRESFVAGIFLSDIPDIDLHDLIRTAAQQGGVYFGVLLAAVTDEDELPLGVSIENLLYRRGFGLSPLLEKVEEGVVAKAHGLETECGPRKLASIEKTH